MFSALEKMLGRRQTFQSKKKVAAILKSKAFSSVRDLNVLPLIYDEKNKKCNIMVFNFDKAIRQTAGIVLEEKGGNRKYPVFRFYNGQGDYICEVRYGKKDANALQRGFWTHTKRAEQYFHSLTGGWIDYSDSPVLVKLFRYALVTSQPGHENAIKELEKDIENLKSNSR
jgi:hypothetical protein